MKATEIFVMVALILLVFALIARFISPSGLGVSITWGDTGMYFHPVSSASCWRRCCASLRAFTPSGCCPSTALLRGGIFR